MLNHFYAFDRSLLPTKFVSTFFFLLIIAAIFALDVSFCLKLPYSSRIAFLTVLSYFSLNYVVVTFQLIFYDPGYVVPELCSPTDRYCEQCAIFKPHRAHHCSICGKCVYKYDHHCEIFRQCIGKYSLPYFFKFFVSSAIVLLLSAIVGAMRWMDGLLSRMFTIVTAVLSFVVLLLGGSLAWEPVFKDITQVDELQKERLERKSWVSNSFSNMGWLWPLGMLFPLAVFHPRDV